MIAGRWFITPHAVRRYQERVAVSYNAALTALIRLSETAHHVREQYPGIDLYRGPRPERVRLVVSSRGADAPQLVTVKASHDATEHSMQPLRVTAHMGGRIVGYDDGIHLDGILAGAAYFDLPRDERDQLPQPDLADWLIDFDLPLDKWAIPAPDDLPDWVDRRLLDEHGCIWGWCASAAQIQWAQRGTHSVRKRTPLAELQRYSPGGKVNMGAGRHKPMDIPYPDGWASSVTWYARGNAAEIERLLTAHIHGIGKLVNHGAGAVLRWEVEPCDHDWSIERDGVLMRRLPAWWPGADGPSEVRRIRPPYAHLSRDLPCVEPGRC